MLARVLSYGIVGIEAYPIEIEVDAGNGLPAVNLVGLADTAVKESRIRVKSAIKNSGFKWPGGRLTINLAPSHIKKEGAGFDLPIALGILAATGQVKAQPLASFCLLGELSLDGTLRPCKGVLPISIGISRTEIRQLIVPDQNAAEAALVATVKVWPMHTLKQVVEFLHEPQSYAPAHIDRDRLLEHNQNHPVDFSEIKGQQAAKRALEVAVAGGHNVLMIGPPGSGKTMLAQRIPTIMPAIGIEEALQITRIHSVAGLLPQKQGIIATAPFRMPHHSISYAGLAGGGPQPRPGEISLAHHGVLFLDELPEFKRDCLESLRQPLEDGCIHICRTQQSFIFPAAFMLVCAMNPCPCGYLTDPQKNCCCSPNRVQEYRSKVSGPLLDRIDIHIEMPPVNFKDLSAVAESEPSAEIRMRVAQARALQRQRFADEPVFSNSRMDSRLIKKCCRLQPQSLSLMKMAMEEMGLSARGYDKVLKVARTIADLACSDEILPEHLAEAVQYRSLETTN